MASNSNIVTLRGKASFARILGDPVPNYSKDGYEWKMDLQISEDTKKSLKGYGIADRVKSKDEYLDGAPFLSFKQSELRKDGKKNDPIPVFDIKGQPWDQETLIGNGSDVDVKFAVVDHGAGKKKGVYIRAVRVLKLVPYTKTPFEPVDEDDDFYVEATESSQEEAPVFLDDDIEDVI